MGNLLLAALVIVASGTACSSRGDAERKAREAQVKLAEQARVARAAAEAKAHEAAQQAAAVEADAETKAKAALAAVRARELATQAKAELDKVYQSKSAYDLDITTQTATSTHAAKLAAMPHITVGDLTVGYEESSGLSMAGSSSRRHFRATWRRGDRDVIVGYQTESNIDVIAFAKLLHKLVPVVEKLI